MLIVRPFLFTFILYISLILTWLWYSYLQVGLNEVSAHTRAVLSFYLQAVSAKSSEIVAVQATWATHLTSEDFAVREGYEPRQRHSANVSGLLPVNLFFRFVLVLWIMPSLILHPRNLQKGSIHSHQTCSMLRPIWDGCWV